MAPPLLTWVASIPIPRTSPLADPSICTSSPRKQRTAQCSTSCRWRAKAANSGSPDAAETKLVSDLLAVIGKLQTACEFRVERYVKQTELFAEAISAARKLESSRTGFAKGGSRLSSLMPGRWTLLLTDSTPVIKNSGSITGLGSLPGAKCTKVQVCLERNGRARTEESVSVLGIINGENSLLGKWRLTGKGGTTLEVTYAEAELMGRTKLRADSKAVLETTYCGDRIRIGRSASGDTFVFEKAAKII